MTSCCCWLVTGLITVAQLPSVAIRFSETQKEPPFQSIVTILSSVFCLSMRMKESVR